MSDCYYATETVAGLLSVSRSTLKKWARRGFGPQRRKIGVRKVGYLAEEVDAFLASRQPVPTETKGSHQC